jgi:hypothetical protein
MSTRGPRRKHPILISVTNHMEHIYSKLHSEKMHQKFGKYLLGVHKKATNLAVLSELGRLFMLDHGL